MTNTDDVHAVERQSYMRVRTLVQCTRVGLVAFAAMLLPMPLAAVQQASSAADARKLQLETQKLELEVASLRSQAVPAWGIAIFGLAVGIAGTASTLWVARRARTGALDQSVHNRRLRTYPRLVSAAAPLATYFPDYGSGGDSIGPDHCARIGLAMSRWYFNQGGLLLSEESRNAYFTFARALTRASRASELAVPAFPADAESISLDHLRDYKEKLAVTRDLNDPDTWSFGKPASSTPAPEERFKDYVFLQGMSSRLRTALSEDLRSRRRPS